MKELVEKLKEKEMTLSTMESCTGGGVANAITNIEGASDVIKYAAVTYSNEFKVKMGVSSEVIDKYSVYSMETANEMSMAISKFANSTYGIGITGKLNRIDKNNLFGSDNIVYVSIYDKKNNKFYNKDIQVGQDSRSKNKEIVINAIIQLFEEIL